MGLFRDIGCMDRHWLAMDIDDGVEQVMSDAHAIHMADELINDESHFEIWPLNQGSGCPVSDVGEPHLHDFYAIQFVRAGKGVHVIDFQPYEIVPNSLFFVSPKQLHLWRVEEEIDGFVMAFTEHFLLGPDAPYGSVQELAFFHSLISLPSLRMSPSQADEVSDLFLKIHGEYTNKSEGYVTVLRAFFHILMVNLKRMFADRIQVEGVGHEPHLARRFKKLVSEKYASQMSIQAYADELGVSVSRLNAVVKEATSNTPGQIVRNELVMAAKRLLAHTDMNVSEICFQLSFEDPSYFGRFFKREAGMPPSAFRQKMQEKYQLSAR